MDNPIIYDYVVCRLKNKQSPAIIQRDLERDIGLKIGKDAIYEYIYRFKYDEWFKFLTRKKKYNYKKYKGKKEMKIDNKTSSADFDPRQEKIVSASKWPNSNRWFAFSALSEIFVLLSIFFFWF